MGKQIQHVYRNRESNLIYVKLCVILAFAFSHVTFVVLSGFLTSDACDDHTISSDSSLGMEFISTKILHAKYSTELPCVAIPTLLLMNVTVMIIQHHVTLTVLRKFDNYLSDIFCYMSVLGWVVVVLFDSQRVSEHPSQGHIHIVGVAMLTVGDAMLHAFTILASQMNSKGPSTEQFYSVIELVYLVCLITFMILFAIHSPGAIQVEYAVLVLFFILSCMNLTVLYYENQYVHPSSDLECNYMHTLIGPVVVFFLFTLVFITQFAHSYATTT